MMQPPFVKKFDFRGIYPIDITDKDAFFLGLAVQKVLPLKKILIGWDTRHSSEQLAYHFIESFAGTEIEIQFLEKCPIDYVTAGANAFDFDFSVMFTGSHNPWNWTGLLMHTKGGESVQGNLVGQIVTAYYEAQTTPFRDPHIDLSMMNDFQPIIEKVYLDKIASLIPLEKIKEFTVLVDIGDGSGSQSLTLLSRALPQVTVQRLNDREVYDDHTPHTADPSNIENMQQLMSSVSGGKYDCGFAFDSDSDRVLAVDENGAYLNGSLIGSALVDIFTSQASPMKRIGYAVDCGPSLYNTCLEQSSLSVFPVPVGRSLLRQMIRDDKVDIAVENVGHFYIRDFFQTDSGVFSLVCILYWMSTHGKLSSLQTQHPDGFREQFTKPVTDAMHQESVETAASFPDYESKEITVDGIRQEYFQAGKLISWSAKRRSGYEKIEKYYFGSLNETDFKQLQKALKHD